jgi:hypothetical protein
MAIASNALAESHVPERQRKENQNQCDKDDVEHVSGSAMYLRFRQQYGSKILLRPVNQGRSLVPIPAPPFWSFHSSFSASGALSEPQSFHQEPSLRPSHQMTPRVAVFCSDLRTPGISVKKNSWLEKSRLHSPRIKKPSASLKSAVSVVSFKA